MTLKYLFIIFIVIGQKTFNSTYILIGNIEYFDIKVIVTFWLKNLSSDMDYNNNSNYNLIKVTNKYIIN